jgi:hypothetical protein
LTGKDWFTTILSTLAFFISVGTAINTVFKKEDNLAMVVKGGPDVRPQLMPGGREALGVSITDQVISFINQGNRPVEITGLRLDVVAADPANHLNSECEGDGRQLDIEVEPFSVKAGESVSKKFRFARRTAVDADEGWAPVEFPSRGNVTRFVACLFVSVALPDMANDLRQMVLQGSIPTIKEPNITVKGQDDDTKPLVLVRRLRLGFW